jgi:anti-anti-sigma regulatory factor
MSAEKGPGTIILRLAGFVDESALWAVSEPIRQNAQRNPGRRYVIDCSGVTGFSATALSTLSGMIKEVRQLGSDVALRHLDQGVVESSTDRLVESLLPPHIGAAIKAMVQRARASARGPAWRQPSVN